jgi:hypothetical protein
LVGVESIEKSLSRLIAEDINDNFHRRDPWKRFWIVCVHSYSVAVWQSTGLRSRVHEKINPNRRQHRGASNPKPLSRSRRAIEAKHAHVQALERVVRQFGNPG